MIEPNSISFRDTAARVVKKENGYFRYIFNEYKSEYNHLMQSGLYDVLVQKQLLIKHDEIPTDTQDERIYKVIYPSQITFQSYPFEWSYMQWRKAISAYLQINHIALKYGMILKDATPFNFYLSGGKAIMFDTSSFVFFKENDTWTAYRQFCEEFLGPIALMHYNGSRWSKLTMSALRGMPLDFISKQLPLKSWFNLTTLLHIHLHGRFSSKSEITATQGGAKKGFSIEKMRSLHKMLFNTITKWTKAYQFNNHWVHYYENDIESAAYLADKEKVIRKWMNDIKPETVVDLGANTGKFSFIAAEYAAKVIAVEYDEICVDKIESKIKDEKIDTLIGEISEPTPNLGFDHKEYSSILVRAKSDMALGLALIHHLYFTNYLNFKQIANYFSNLSNRYSVIEFIDKEDQKVQIIAKNKIAIAELYTQNEFERCLKNYFKIIEKHKITDSARILYLLKNKVN